MKGGRGDMDMERVAVSKMAAHSAAIPLATSELVIFSFFHVRVLSFIISFLHSILDPQRASAYFCLFVCVAFICFFRVGGRVVSVCLVHILPIRLDPCTDKLS